MTQPVDRSHQNGLARLAADTGKDGENWSRNKKKVAIKSELVALEQLADRVGFQCTAQLRLAEIVPGFQYDQDSIRAIRQTVNSMSEALGNVERLAREVDLEEFGSPANTPVPAVSISYEAGLAGVEGAASDIGVQANAESYMLTLIPSRRRPNPQTISVLRYMINSMQSALG